MSKLSKLWRIERDSEGRIMVVFFGDTNDVPVTLEKDEAKALAKELAAEAAKP